MRIGFTGTREGMSSLQKEQFVMKLFELNPTEFHHGDCRGADGEAHNIVREFFPNVKIIGHLPQSFAQRAFRVCDEYKDPLPYLVRDHKIVDISEFMFGAPLTDDEIVRSGTWATIRYARKQNKPLLLLKR
jgi:hypothetical protein